MSPSLSFSFDDGLDPSKQSNASQWNASLLHSLSEANLKAIYFPAGRIVDSKEGMELVSDWSDAGHLIGNHTYRHQNLNSNKVTAEKFIEDVQRGERLLSHLENWTARLRFPYLKEGATARERDALRDWLDKQGYRSGGVSIDASDWYYDARFTKWKADNPNKDVSPFRDAYLDHIWDRAQYYDSLAREVLRKEVRHVLLLHTNEINTAFLPDIINMFRQKGWAFVSAEEALETPLFRLKPSALPAGESVIWAVAKNAGVTSLRYPAEDAKYEKPILDAMGL